ncbi:hypothetical protein COOONC_17700 [Cooperia oncophora]
MLTGSSQRVYPYERTAEFAKEIKRLASPSESPRFSRERVHAAAGIEIREGVYSTPAALHSEVALQRDALVEPLNVNKINEEKVTSNDYDANLDDYDGPLNDYETTLNNYDATFDNYAAFVNHAALDEIQQADSSTYQPGSFDGSNYKDNQHSHYNHHCIHVRGLYIRPY